MEIESLSLLHWALLILIGIVGLIMGFYLGKGSKKNSIDPASIAVLENKNKSLQSELEACRKKVEKLGSEAQTSDTGFDAVSAKSVFGKRIKENDLKLVEGIGPKIEGLFHNFDIKTWKDLSEVTVERCYEVLSSGGDRYKIHDPSSWPMQAKMAHQGDWKALHKWQVEHKHGKL
ncbi:hypothetical protein PP178_04890 [Zeaxanthinibacter sp. PT1]|uniref:hypothetical protein n=1 Tax=Zeaxanthinibacter TaxID=561554 RepID=UPI00234902F8|nr:hypothetical protein [Zeaxanthinibacter sp. PT1]MDC6350877.1 hypothetical protein [Zeaxanthinibacter sp. PT1]